MKLVKVVAVSGGFDPIHVGHLRMFEAAKELGDFLVVIINNDNWLKAKKGYMFMPEKERVEIIEAIKYVDAVMLTSHKKNDKDTSVARELGWLNPTIFANGGDRKKAVTAEDKVCKLQGIKQVFGVGGGKVRSSSELVKKCLKWIK